MSASMDAAATPAVPGPLVRAEARYPELRGRVAIITGAAKGIGQGIAARLASEGMRLVAADIDADSLAATADALRKLDVPVVAFHGDVSQIADIDRLFDATMQSFETVDVVVNNAADLRRRRLLDDDDGLLEKQLSTNVAGPYLCSQRAAAIMRRNGRGSIIHISSVGAIRAHHRGLPYDVTKGAINSMTQAMAVDLGGYGIRVNAVGPGLTHTYRTEEADPAAYRESANRAPLGRYGTVPEIAAVVAFLASTEASYVTGQVIYVDGGLTAQLDSVLESTTIHPTSEAPAPVAPASTRGDDHDA
jgi:3-oxoacyl-[acyl-carrier protein] reductase